MFCNHIHVHMCMYIHVCTKEQTNTCMTNPLCIHVVYQVQNTYQVVRCEIISNNSQSTVKPGLQYGADAASITSDIHVGKVFLH